MARIWGGAGSKTPHPSDAATWSCNDLVRDVDEPTHDELFADSALKPKAPLPPEDLRSRVAGTPSAEHFDTSGRQSVDDLGNALAAIGSDLAGHRTMLDFGCGCGRVLRWLGGLRDVELHGCDID